MITLMYIFGMVKGDAVYGLRRLVATHGHKPEIVAPLKNILDRLEAGESFTTNLSAKTTILEHEYRKALEKSAKTRRKEKRSVIDLAYSSLMAGYFAPPPSTPLQQAQQAILDGMVQVIEDHREEQQMATITRTLFDHIVRHEPRRVEEAANAILSAIKPRIFGLKFSIDGPQDDLPKFMNRQYHATDPLRRTLNACYKNLPW